MEKPKISLIDSIEILPAILLEEIRKKRDLNLSIYASQYLSYCVYEPTFIQMNRIREAMNIALAMNITLKN